MASIITAVQNTIAENFGGGDKYAKPEDQFSIDEVPSLDGKVAVVTGGSEGIGFAAVQVMLSKGLAKVYILSINKEHIENATSYIKEELGQAAADKIKWLQLDLADWVKIPSVVKEITDSTDRVDIVINNAARGIMTYQLTDYGVDRHMAANHMGHVILTSHLLPLIKKTAANGNTVRISNQSSNAHQNPGKDLKFASLDELNTDLGPQAQYGRSKLAGILYAKYLNKHLTSKHPNILANATHPGFVKTRMSEEHAMEPYPRAGVLMKDFMAPFKKDQFEGALSTLYAATAVTKSGRYFCPPAVDEPGTDLAQNEELSEQLMKLTIEVITDKTRSESVDKGCPMVAY